MEARTIWYMLQTACAAVAGWIGYFLGCWDGLLYALTAFVIIDYFTGVMCAVVEGTLSGAVSMKGVIKKLTIFLIVGVAHVIDGAIGNGGLARTATLIFFISNEGISLLENTGRLGLPIPPGLKEAIKQLHAKSRENGSSDK